MKIFHTERGKEVVYVQMNDITYLSSETDLPIPASIFTKVFTGTTIVDDSNRFNFVRFCNEKEVKFFKELDFILDYSQYKDLSDTELDAEWQNLATKANEIAEKWNSMDQDERKKNHALLEEHQNLQYMMNFLSEIYAVNHKKRSMPFPNFVKRKKVKKTKK